ncbi:MAG: hypothetical protein GF364_12630 [Candidatus Lokiarchaeota archaeon]|nr:hypothetical protein [Candidatus Lokiarchaeota archaeon]
MGERTRSLRPFWFTTTPSKAGDSYYFMVPAFAIHNKYIYVDREYKVYFEETEKIDDIHSVTLDEIEGFLNFKSKPAKSGTNYRFTIPAFLVKNNYIAPEDKREYWIFVVE